MSYQKKNSFPSTFQSMEQKENELDPYSTVIVEDLLQGTNDWRNIQDIIRLTIKALTDVVKSQSETLRELEKQMPTRASKTELNTALSQKANTTDVSKTIAEVASTIDQKVSFDDVQLMLRDYTLKSDMQYLLSNKVTIDEARSLVENKVSSTELKSEIHLINQKFEELQREFIKKTVDNNNIQKELEKMQIQLNSKANQAEINIALEAKANKSSINGILHKKANKLEIEDALNRKADIIDLQNIISLLNSKADVATIDNLANIIENKTDKSDFNLLVNNLSNKIEKSEFDLIDQRIQIQKQEINQRVDKIRTDIEHLNNSVTQQFQKMIKASELEYLKQNLNQKVNIDEVDALNVRTNDTLARFKEDLLSYMQELEDKQNEKWLQVTDNFSKIEQQNENFRQQMVSGQIEREQHDKEINKLVKNLQKNNKTEIQKENDKLIQDFSVLQKTVEDMSKKKLDKKEFIDFKKQISTQFLEKVDIQEVQSALNASQADVSSRFLEYKEEVKLQQKKLESNLNEQINQKANFTDITNLLNCKADVQLVQSIIQQKFSAYDLDYIKNLVERVQTDIFEKVSIKEFENLNQTVKAGQEQLQKEIILKASIKDVCMILDTKANIEDVNKSLGELSRQMEVKANMEDLNNVVNDQAIINESLCTENIVGRWMWKSGELKQGQQVPWESQVVNTLPDNYLWEKDKTSILTVAPGLYEVIFGFFAPKKPVVQLLLNGEAIVLSSNSNGSFNQNQLLQNSKQSVMTQKYQQQLQEKENISGISQVEFLVLPARARISIVYEGEQGGEGFIGLKRL